MADYVTEARIKSKLGDRTDLLDRDGDGSEDSGLLDDIIDEIGAVIDAHIAQRFGTSNVPLAAVTDTPATPKFIQKIAEHLVLEDLHSWAEPDGRDATYHRDKAEGYLAGLRKADFDIDVSRAKGYEAGTLATYDAGTPTYAGEDSSGVDRTSGI